MYCNYQFLSSPLANYLVEVFKLFAMSYFTILLMEVANFLSSALFGQRD